MRIFSILFFVIFTSCSTLRTSQTGPALSSSGSHAEGEESDRLMTSNQKSLPDRIADSDAYYHYLRGYLSELDNDLPGAYQEYKSALILDPKSSVLLYEIANVAVRLGDFQSAEEFIQSLLKIEPDQLEGLVLLGDIYVNQNKLDQAISAYQKAVVLKPDFQETYFEIASLYIREKKFPDAEKTISRMIALNPKSPIGYYYMGRIFLEERKTKEALGQFRESLRRVPSYEPAWMGIGLIYEAEGDHQKALQHYRKFLETAGVNHREARYRIIQILIQDKSFSEAEKELEKLLSVDPNDIEANFRLAVLLAEKKEYLKSIQLMNVVIDRRGNDPRLLDYLGTLYEANNDNPKAIETYQRVIEGDKTYTDGYIHLASLYVKMKNYEQGLKVLKEARGANPRKEDIYFSAEGWVYLQMERFDESLAAFRQAIKINPKSPDFHYNLGQVFDKMNQFEAMEKEMQKAIELEPNYVNALNYLGYSYAEKNMKLKEARELITRALKIRPDDGFIIDSLAWVYYRQGDLDKAVTELKRAITFVPDDSTIHEHLGEIYLKKNLKKEAKEEFLQSIEMNPSNQKLIDRFQEYGFGDPKSEERIQKALKKMEPRQAPSTNKTNQTESNHSKI
ncbi:MAG: tetratricopeptide repeat protein [Nitrospiria bacterium]